jgi:hypothetical protein
MVVMVNNSSLQKWDRLRQKHLSQQFLQEIIHGLNCSPFEAQAILDTVLRVFRPYYETSGALRPGQLYCSVVSQHAPPNMALKDCPMITVVLTLDAGEEDLHLKEHSGVEALRRHRLERMCHEAFQQGGLLTVEDLAHRLLNCGERTLCRDLAQLRKQHIVLPLRSQIKDMGRSLSHRAIIVRSWLAGKEYSEIARATFHSPGAVQNYVEKFKRSVALAGEGYDGVTISFLVRISVALVKEYLEIHKKAKIVSFRQKELSTFLKKEHHIQPIRRAQAGKVRLG